MSSSIRLSVLGLASGVLSAASVFIPHFYFWAPGFIFGVIVVVPYSRLQGSRPTGRCLSIIGSTLAYAIAYSLHRVLEDGSIPLTFIRMIIAGGIGSTILALLLTRHSMRDSLRLVGAGIIGGVIFGILLIVLPGNDQWIAPKLIAGYCAWQSIVGFALGIHRSAPDTPARRLPQLSLRSLILLVALAGSGYGLWARWEPWQLAGIGTLDAPPSGYAIDGFVLKRRELVHLRAAFPMLDETIMAWQFALTTDQVENTTPSLYVKKDIRGSAASTLKHPSLSNLQSIVISRDFSEIRAFCGSNVVVDWNLRRPEHRWGFVWLPEFWLALLLGGTLLWSLHRDTLDLETAAEPNSDQPQSSDGLEAVG